MAVKRVHYGEIVEVTFKFPGEGYKVHPALVLSGDNLQEDEEGMFYAVLISSKNYNPQYTLEIQNEWLTKPMLKQSFFVTHFMTYFTPDEVTQSYNTAVRSVYMDRIISKVIRSIFEWDVE
jgi:hypothetical protein